MYICVTGKVARLNLQKRFRNAVRQTVSREATTALEIKEGTGRMRQAIWATLHHTIIQDPDNRHIYCPVNSWCLYKYVLPSFVQSTKGFYVILSSYWYRYHA